MFVLKKYQRLFLIFSVMVAGGMLSSAIAAPLDENTVLYMSFDQEPDEFVVKDESGYGNDGKIVGTGIEWTEDGKFNGALKFDGTSKITIPHSDNLDLDKEITLEIWFRTKEPQSWNFLLYKVHEQIEEENSYEWGLYLTGESKHLDLYLVNPDDFVKTVGMDGAYSDDEWHFVAGTYDGETMKLFVDGKIVSTTWSDELRKMVGPVEIGTFVDWMFFIGVLDEVRICNVALTEEQLKHDYQNGYNLTAVDSTGKLSTTWAEIKAAE